MHAKQYQPLSSFVSKRSTRAMKTFYNQTLEHSMPKSRTVRNDS
jgi:hypothetical protein